MWKLFVEFTPSGFSAAVPSRFQLLSISKYQQRLNIQSHEAKVVSSHYASYPSFHRLSRSAVCVLNGDDVEEAGLTTAAELLNVKSRICGNGFHRPRTKGQSPQLPNLKNVLIRINCEML